ncbi:MAG: BlaI/MecI/CopY family transcriptional regulator [Actinomycetia bacterium]|nr:BlaI/MecI/CopY family transcriptional regulator [Actinomycetes bacterium]
MAVMVRRGRAAAVASLGDLERAVLDTLWDSSGACTVRDVHRCLAETRDIAYTTVLTVLDRLAKKGLVTRERAGRAWRYLPAASREQLTAQVMRSTLTSAAAGDRGTVLLHFLDGASPEEIAALRVALDSVERRRS